MMVPCVVGDVAISEKLACFQVFAGCDVISVVLGRFG
jgi:hypothetical protein